MTWFDRFFDEKDLDEVIFEVDSPNGTTNFISNQNVIEQIKNAPESEQKEIKHILIKIDFNNGDVNHFLEHLAQAMAQDL